jgi:hypothetical protein
VRSRKKYSETVSSSERTANSFVSVSLECGSESEDLYAYGTSFLDVVCMTETFESYHDVKGLNRNLVTKASTISISAYQ